MKQAEEVRSNLSFVHDIYTSEIVSWNKDFSMNIHINTPSGKIENLECAVAGIHQISNIYAVLSTLELVKDKFPISEQSLRNGLKNIGSFTGLFARIQLIRDNPPLILDVGHNPAGLRKLVETLHLCGYKEIQWNVCFGVMADKNVEEMLSILQPITSQLYAISPKYERALPAQELALKALSLGIKNTEITNSVAEAVRVTMETQNPTIIVGSFYLADEAIVELSKYSFGLLKK